MVRFLGGRAVGGLISIFGASVVAFVFLRALPSRPGRLILGPLASDEAVRQLEHQLGLDDPLPLQYWHYITDFLRGDWGFSYTAGQPVREQIGARLPASLELGLWAFLFAFGFALLLALLTTYRRRPVIDAITRFVAFVGLGTPPFWLALVLLVLLSSSVHLLPGPEGRFTPDTVLPPKLTGMLTIDALLTGHLAAFWDAFKHILLPAICLGLGGFSFLVRLLRVNLTEVSREPFLLVARSKGLSRWRTYERHALPNAFLPTLTASGILLAQFVAGSVLVEKVFNWPGVGGLVVDSILRQDYSVVQTFILLSAFAYVAVNLVVDVLYGVLDPRTRHQGSLT
jgi:peptide/nickel transport system permease protein